MNEIEFTEVMPIGENAHGYRFGVGRLNDRWLGFAIGALDGGGSMLAVMPEISEGATLGLTDRDLVIQMTGAIAQDPEHAFGGIDTWFVAEELRGSPDHFRCFYCDQIGCSGACEEPDVDDLP